MDQKGSFYGMQSSMSIYEGRQNLAWRRHVIRVSIEAAKYFAFADGLSVTPIKVVSLTRYVEETVGPLCTCLFAQFTAPHVHLAPLWFWLSFN